MIAVLREQRDPIRQELLVDMVMAALEWDGGREQDAGAVPGKAGDKALRSSGRKMLGHFETDHQIEPAAEIESGFKIAHLDQRRIARDLLRIQPGAINATQVANVTGLQGFEPGADPAADVQHGGGPD